MYLLEIYPSHASATHCRRINSKSRAKICFSFILRRDVESRGVDKKRRVIDEKREPRERRVWRNERTEEKKNWKRSKVFTKMSMAFDHMHIRTGTATNNHHYLHNTMCRRGSAADRRHSFVYYYLRQFSDVRSTMVDWMPCIPIECFVFPFRFFFLTNFIFLRSFFFLLASFVRSIIHFIIIPLMK